MAINLHTRFRGYLVVDSNHDTTNLVCRRGHIYADGEYLVAALDAGTLAERRALRKVGTPVMDGDFGELSVRFRPGRFRDVARILLPRRTANLKSSRAKTRVLQARLLASIS